MKNSTIRILFFIGAITLTGLFGIQFYLLKTAFDHRQKVFESSVQIALIQVISRLQNYDFSKMPQASPVIKKSSNYYIVDANQEFECEILEFYLKSEFKRAGIKTDFEYAIYDCFSDEMVYGNYISFKNNGYKNTAPSEFPKHQDFVYYFAVLFPTVKADIVGSLKIWFIFALISLCVLVFMIYAVWIILGQKRFSELQRTFVNTVSHEFRTPISANSVAIEYLQQNNIIKNDKRLTKYIELIHLQNTRLTNLIDRLLNLSKSKNSEFDLNYEPVNIADLCKDVISVHQSNNSNVTFNTLFPSQPVIVDSDKFHCGNILHVLIDNAIKYSGKSPVIDINVESNSKAMFLRIKDNGPGIPQKYRKKVFQQFYRIPTGNVHNVKGFGIGLYYVKLLSKKMKWKIRIDDETKGTKFIIKIPKKLNY